MTRLEAALSYWERGWSIIPIRAGHKRPAIKWLEYQERQPTEDEIIAWWEEWPDAEIAIVTGALSGLVIVDCDNKDALHAAFDAGMRSPIRVKTKRGEHLYFLHPRDGVRRGPRAGVNSRGADWPKIDGLDFRGDGSYALLPPSTGYSWAIPAGLETDDAPVWQDWTPELPASPDSVEFDFASLDLTKVRTITAEDFMSEWDRTARYVRERFPTTLKLPTGGSNGRNERVMRHVSECVMDGYFGDELRLRGYAFMREFFVDPLPEAEFQATVRSIEEAERRNHPERFREDGSYIPRPGHEPASGTAVTPEVLKAPEPRRLILMEDADELQSKSEGRQFLIEPWLPPQTIVQVYGYSGHGKSLFLQHAMGALTAGRKYFGPFEIGRAARVLYLDWENGMATLGRRLEELRSAHGNAKDRLQVWTPYVDNEEINLNTSEGLMRLQGWIEQVKPDVVVLDTLRSAYPGLQENDASEWSKINQLAMRIRNAGMACIMVHHSNKPGESGVGREAGSTNQLTVLETQIRITQVFEDKETATMKAGLYDGDYENPVFALLRSKLAEGFRLYMVMEVRYGKVREWSDVHDMVQWVGLAAHDETDERAVVSSRSTKQRAKDMALDGIAPERIAALLSRPLRLINSWLEIG